MLCSVFEPENAAEDGQLDYGVASLQYSSYLNRKVLLQEY